MSVCVCGVVCVWCGVCVCVCVCGERGVLSVCVCRVISIQRYIYILCT